MGASRYGVVARIVFDGGAVVVPEEMGKSAGNQMAGTVAEKLSELACRVCYDSLGRGRSSEELHRHILEVQHLSVYEHAHFTVRVKTADPEAFLNRPGLWVERLADSWFRVTLNPRAVIEWDDWSLARRDIFPGHWGALGDALRFHAEFLCPWIVGSRERNPSAIGYIQETSELVDPKTDEEKWVTLFLAGSRGFSHEMVRHGDFTAISQRSTRYVDEDGSPWLDHPLVQDFLADAGVDVVKKRLVTEHIHGVKGAARGAYGTVAEILQNWLLSKRVVKSTARKQARGAARGYLGIALSTELVFSASVGQWKRMLRMRCSAAADAEIRAVFCEALRELQSCRYADDFSGFRLERAPDGIGEVAVETTPAGVSPELR